MAVSSGRFVNSSHCLVVEAVVGLIEIVRVGAVLLVHVQQELSALLLGGKLKLLGVPCCVNTGLYRVFGFSTAEEVMMLSFALLAGAAFAISLRVGEPQTFPATSFFLDDGLPALGRGHPQELGAVDDKMLLPIT